MNRERRRKRIGRCRSSLAIRIRDARTASAWPRSQLPLPPMRHRSWSAGSPHTRAAAACIPRDMREGSGISSAPSTTALTCGLSPALARTLARPPPPNDPLARPPHQGLHATPAPTRLRLSSVPMSVSCSAKRRRDSQFRSLAGGRIRDRGAVRPMEVGRVSGHVEAGSAGASLPRVGVPQRAVERDEHPVAGTVVQQRKVDVRQLQARSADPRRQRRPSPAEVALQTGSHGQVFDGIVAQKPQGRARSVEDPGTRCFRRVTSLSGADGGEFRSDLLEGRVVDSTIILPIGRG